MASTIYTYNLTGGRVFPVAFEYLARRFVKITLVGATRQELQLNVDYRFISKTEIETTIVWAPGEFQTIEVRRVTSATDRLVNFTDGSILRSQDLNISQIQAIHIAEEGRDVAENSMLGSGSNWNALGLPIKNVGYPTEPNDAANVAYVSESLEYTLRTSEKVRVVPDDRANKLLGFDSNRQPVALIPSTGSSIELELELASEVTTKGASKIARTAIRVNSISDLIQHPLLPTAVFVVIGYHAGSKVGGGKFIWDQLSTLAPDNGFVFAVPGIATGRFLRVHTGQVTVDMYGAYPDDLTKDSAKAFRDALAAHMSVYAGPHMYFLNSYAVGAYYGAPAIVLKRGGSSLLCANSTRLVFAPAGAASGGVGLNAVFQIDNAMDCTIGPFKVQNRAPIGTDLNSVDTLQIFNGGGANIMAIDDTYRISNTSGSIQQSIISRDSKKPETSGTVYQSGITVTGAKCSATINLKHHHNMKLVDTKVRIDLDAHRPSWMGDDVAPLKFTGGTVNANDCVAEDCEFTVYRSGGGPVELGRGYIQITKATATLSRCVLNVNRLYGGSESEKNYPAPDSPELSTVLLDNCKSSANIYYGPSFAVKVRGGSMGSIEKNIQFAALNPPSPLTLQSYLDVSGCDIYCNRLLSDREDVLVNITFSDVDLYFTRTTQNCFEIHRTVGTWFHSDNVRNHLDSVGLYVLFSGNLRLSNVWKKTSATTEIRLESNSTANPTRIIIDGAFDFKDIYTQGGTLINTQGIEACTLYTATAPVLNHGGAFTQGTILFNRGGSATNGWRSVGVNWVPF